MELVEVKIHGISYSDNTSGAFAIILDEVNGNKKLPIVIGSYEAQSIAIALEKNVKTSRPLTHELFKRFADKFNISLNHIIIHKLSDGVFYSNMVCEKDSEVVKVDSRTSDAIALSIRFNAPIFVTKEILSKAGFEDDKKFSEDLNLADEKFFSEGHISSADSNAEKTKDIKKISTRNIKKMLEKSIQNEDYELAARLRDELDLRKKV